MDLIPIVEWIGDTQTTALAGLIVGIIFGIAAQRSRFCLRAATVEFASGVLGKRMAVWLLTFSTAVVWTQAAQYAGFFHSADARMLAVTGSFSGAIIGGLNFGVGMGGMLAGGCAIGTGVTGGSIFAATAWLALFCM